MKTTSRLTLLGTKNVSEKVVENIKTNKYFTFNNFVSEYRAIYEIIWKKMAGSDRPQITI